MLKELLEKRCLPKLMTAFDGSKVQTIDDWRKRRLEIIEMLSCEEYGFTPASPKEVMACIEPMDDWETNTHAFANKAIQQVIHLSFETPNGDFNFPFTLAVPKKVKKAPVFIYIGFRRDFPDRYVPVEEILEHGFAVASFCYQDVSSDSADFDKLATMYPRDEKTGWGKIGMWAFAASRVLDYLETRDDIDAARACVSGHSRLGKTALWCAAQDERFAMVVSNNSGCSGAALSRGKTGETIQNITDVFPYWFCGNYRSWSGKENEMPFDQHMLLSLIAPRQLYVNSAADDDWCDPESEFLACNAASAAWRVHRNAGLVTPDALPELDIPLMNGDVCYHVRTGAHFHSRTDWLWQMACRERNGI